MAKPLNVNAIAFDANGTTFDDTEIFIETINRMFEKLGLSRLPAEEVRRRFGQPWTRIFRERGIGPEAKSERELYEIYNGIYSSFPPPKLSRGLENALIRLKGKKNTDRPVLAIVSTQQLKMTERALGRLMKLFDSEWSVHGASDKVRAFEELKRIFGSVLYVGDQVDDILKAHEAGILAAAYTGGLHAEDMLRAQKPDFVINHFSQLLRLQISPN